MELLRNPWVIGVGTTIIAGLILYFVFGIGKPKSKRNRSTTIKNEDHPAPLPAPDKGTDTRLTPEAIVSYLDSLPPLQRESAGDHYKGIKVSWRVHLESGTSLKIGKLYLIMRSGRSGPQVTCEVDSNQYPILGVINQTQTFTIEGEIQKIDLLAIELTNCRLHF